MCSAFDCLVRCASTGLGVMLLATVLPAQDSSPVVPIKLPAHEVRDDGRVEAERRVEPDLDFFIRSVGKPFRASLGKLIGEGEATLSFKPVFSPASDAFAWYGRSGGPDPVESMIVLRRVDQAPARIFATIYRGATIHSIEPRSGVGKARVHVIRELRFRAHQCHTVSHAGSPPLPAAPPAKGVTRIDVAFIYADLVLNQAKAVDPGDPHGLIEGRMLVALSNLNQALQESGAAVRVWAAKTAFVHEEFEEFTDSALNLQWIADKEDAHWDAAHAIRQCAQADLVCWLVGRGGSRAYVLKNPDASSAAKAFSVVAFRRLIQARYLLAHELAHNLGCCHEAGQTMADCEDYARGWPFSVGDQAVTTIMCVSDQENRIGRFSNPDQQYLGVTTGDEHQAFNVKEINKNAPIVTGFNGG